MEDKKKLIQKSQLCFICLKKGHRSDACKVKIACQVCGKRHLLVMCPEVQQSGKKEQKSEPAHSEKSSESSTMNNAYVSRGILLQTLVVKLNGFGESKSKLVRVLLDNGAQRSCIMERTADSLNLKPVGTDRLAYTLFSGVRTEQKTHKRYRVCLSSLKNDFSCNLFVLDQPKICGDIPGVADGPWVNELKRRRIELTDQGQVEPDIQILLGSDVYGKLLTGRVVQLDCGLTAMETSLGWTISGKLKQECGQVYQNLALSVTDHVLSNCSIAELWSLDSLGIRDSAEVVSEKELEAASLEHFKKTVKQEESGRYEVQLPFTISPTVLQDNRQIAEQRLRSTSRKLKAAGLWDEYDRIFKDWQDARIIEPVKEEMNGSCHYLPHRAVVKPSSQTTKVRPVFDASCKSKGSVSLNDCLEKGQNLLEVIPAVLLRFRMKKYGVLADIKKAFLQIGVHPPHRDFLRFLWYKSKEETELQIYRHRRVVFGVSSSPFLLGAVINFHLSKVQNEDAALADDLLKSLYVDNVVISVDSVEEYHKFKEFAVRTFSEASMDLCQWEMSAVKDSRDGLSTDEGCSLESGRLDVTTVLGLRWDKSNDMLFVNFDDLEPPGVITKRVVLSMLQKLYDPMGFLAPVAVMPKMLLQDSWIHKLGWDDQLPDEQASKFRQWLSSLHCVQDIRLPRQVGNLVGENWSLHVFVDASKVAFAAAVFLRIVTDGRVSVQLLMAKSRVSPVKKVTIPRLELLACVVGARLANFVAKSLGLEGNVTFWSDSTTAIAWIKRDENWGVFVMNRVAEIRSLTRREDWIHVPGHMNPADLPSRGCTTEELLQSRWWEGPAWLRQDKETWPRAADCIDEEQVSSERKKTIISNFAQESGNLFDGRVSSYWKTVKVVAYYLRWKNRSRGPRGITMPELNKAEVLVLKKIQREIDLDTYKTKGLKIRTGEDQLYRVISKITEGQDRLDFVYPILLPSKHQLVELMVRDVHEKNCHAGVQTVMKILRERYWIVKCRLVVKKVVSACVTCKRFTVKPLNQEEIALPTARTEMVGVFQVTGVDLAGPLYLRGGTKVWVVLYTCAVYRAVHLEVVNSLSTEAFLQSFRRFVSRRVRPAIVYSDQGTNFVGLVNLMKHIVWKKVQQKLGLERIDWRLNPPASPWWGGWWERLVRSVKGLLIRVLGKSTVDLDELTTILCEAEAVLNSRPLTYISEDANDLMVLSPSSFLKGPCLDTVEDLVEASASGLRRRFVYQRRLLEDLKDRFRSEYLSTLVQRARDKGHKTVKVGDVVLIGSEDRKRVLWPVGRVTEVIAGRDGLVRVVKIKTANGFLTRPIQKVYPLELEFPADDVEIMDEPEEKAVTAEESVPVATGENGYRTRSGRLVKLPVKF